MKKVYLGCSLTGSSDAFVDEVKSLFETLSNHFEMLPFISLTNIVPKNNTEVFEFDINQIENSDFMVAICTYPSTGMGYEINHALNIGKKVFAFAKHEDKISKFIDGGITHPNYKFFRVGSFIEIKDIIS